ncbi:MAG TPA: hypothetical protein VKU19_37505 [Bryobacteraceae bacterium]|nr:hypothetical protein [Bryobacteraceae bacterium]
MRKHDVMRAYKIVAGNLGFTLLGVPAMGKRKRKNYRGECESVA